MKRAIAGSAILILIAIAAATLYVVDLFRYAKHPANPEGSERTVVLAPGQDVGVLSRLLEREGVIQHPAKFRLYARVRGYDKRLKAGEYVLSPGMAPEGILLAVVSGKVRLYRLTVPEGYSIRQIAAAVAQAGLGPAAGLIEMARDPEFLAREGVDAKSFEGYLFPDTYYFPRDVSIATIIRTMVRRFRSVFTPEWESRSADLGFSIHEMITLASIIEKETGSSSERPIISSVFHNRLDKEMRLESDPTVIYGIDDFAGNITRKHLATPTPYNTYTSRGLPPGPIANPGKAAISAALYPADTPFLYFVAKGDGTHQFSGNIRDHNQAVRRYQLRR